MEIDYLVLGSGSSGNASLLRVEGAGLLIDGGLGPRQIAWRLKTHGRTWNDVSAVLLTHTHADHWQEATLKQLVGQRIPLIIHADHAAHLTSWSPSFRSLQREGLVEHYREGETASLCREKFAVSAIRVSHDAPATFGFRIACGSASTDGPWEMGFLSDLGVWRREHVEHVRGVDLLAVEFNHDVQMQRASGRPRMLIDRVLGDYGHLSNEQAAELVAAIVQETGSSRLKNIVQLHLSRQCNRPDLAQKAAHRVLSSWERPPRLQTADQDRPLRVRVVSNAAVKQGTFAFAEERAAS
ncbi:MAG: MBL fold metallo-hydrolase [Planctomycetaceae bacterium]|nr:MBL fold metallo-hydrolase [Planctomycetaceae bacterium]